MRLLNWPIGLPITSMEPMTGPRSIGAASSESISGYVQTSASAFGVQEWSFTLAPFRDNMARAYRGLITGLHGGSNAVRVPFIDPDRLSYLQAGLAGFTSRQGAFVPHSNGKSHSNSKLTRASYPVVPASSVAARQATIVNLQDIYWGEKLDVGSRIGFQPFHFGVYEITEVISAGKYRIWPPLRKAIDLDTYATLEPVMAMRLKGQSGANLPRGLTVMEGLQLTMVEVPDDVLRKYIP